MFRLTHKEKQAILDSVANTPHKEQVLTAFQKGVQYALTKQLKQTNTCALFQPKRS